MPSQHRSFPVYRDGRGRLIPVEFDELPFVPQRVFVVDEVPAGSSRGGHGPSRTDELLVCLEGTVRVRQLVDGAEREDLLEQPGSSVLVREGTQVVLTYLRASARLLVLASGPYSMDGLPP